MNDIFQEHVNNFVITYLDNILIFSKNKGDHVKHIHLVLEKLYQ